MERKFFSIDDVKRAHKGHWFDVHTMNFFKSRVAETVYESKTGLVYFVSSEKGPGVGAKRLYSVREFNPSNGMICTVGPFQGYKTSSQAKAAAKRLADF